MKPKSIQSLKRIAVTLGACIAFSTFALAQHNHAESKEAKGGKESVAQTLTGEVVDLMCYLDHAAKGEKHAECAKTCIESGGPVGLLVGDKVYLLVGEHKPINNTLAPLAAQTVTVKGKIVERSGMRMIENAEIVKK